MKRDELFQRFMVYMIVVLALYGAGMVISFFIASDTIITRLISGFGAMFVGVLGLGSGYLLGQRNGNGHNGG